MSRVSDALLGELGSDASHIASLAYMVATALQADPDTSVAGEAVEGLQTLARTLSDRLLTLADPNA